MKKTRYTEEQIAFALKQAETGTRVGEVCRKMGISEATKRLPVRIQTDNGSELISKSLDKWAYEHGVTMDFSRPGKPTDNPFIESFNGSLRDECLNMLV
ncbi:DDE-type integrase/transposase/recombinase [Salmonella enterica]|nr:DDE-type integrase/transposase/recombinase [Salmonella enterica]